MKSRTDVINHLASKFNNCKYLEIGLQDSAQNFDKIEAKFKYSIDPDKNANATFRSTSDDFFNDWNPSGDTDEIFDIVFIDGLHTAEQVKKDFENSIRVLKPNGFIVLHDCNPEKEEYTIVPRPKPTGHWNGDVWRFAVAMRGYEMLDRCTVNIDNGCMIFRNNGNWSKANFGISEMKFSEFDKSRAALLNLVTWEEFIERWN